MSYASGSDYPASIPDTFPLPGKGKLVSYGFGGMALEEHESSRYYAFVACFLTSIVVRTYVMFNWIWVRNEIDWWGITIPEYAGLSTQTLPAAANFLNSLLTMALVVAFVSNGHYNVYKDWNMLSFLWQFHGPATGLSFYMMINPITPGPEIWATFLYKIIISFGLVIGGMSLYSVCTIADAGGVLAQMTSNTPAMANACDVFIQVAVSTVPRRPARCTMHCTPCAACCTSNRLLLSPPPPVHPPTRSPTHSPATRTPDQLPIAAIASPRRCKPLPAAAAIADADADAHTDACTCIMQTHHTTTAK